MSVLVVGSVGYDTVFTPAASGTDLLGGSATFFSIAASFYTPVSMIGVVGDDFRQEDVDLFKSHHIDVSGLKRVHGKTFRWSGKYGTEDVNLRDTLDLQLNVFAGFKPSLTFDQRELEYLFLANIDPDLQLQALSQMALRPKLVAADTINFWIDSKKDSLTEVVKSVDVVFMDETEIRTFAGESNLVKAARNILDLGPLAVIAKRGEHGVLVLHQDFAFAAPAFPLDRVVDPTGAGDSFAGGFMGYLAETGDLSGQALRRASVIGSVMGSFTVQDLSVRKLSSITYTEVLERLNSFVDLTAFHGLESPEDLPWQEKLGETAQPHSLI